MVMILLPRYMGRLICPLLELGQWLCLHLIHHPLQPAPVRRGRFISVQRSWPNGNFDFFGTSHKRVKVKSCKQQNLEANFNSVKSEHVEYLTVCASVFKVALKRIETHSNYFFHRSTYWSMDLKIEEWFWMHRAIKCMVAVCTLEKDATLTIEWILFKEVRGIPIVK